MNLLKLDRLSDGVEVEQLTVEFVGLWTIRAGVESVGIRENGTSVSKDVGRLEVRVLLASTRINGLSLALVESVGPACSTAASMLLSSRGQPLSWCCLKSWPFRGCKRA